MHLAKQMTLIIMSMLFLASSGHAARIKDITTIAGVRDNQLVGYGLVVGLSGTGDKVTAAPFTQQSFINMLIQFGIRLPTNTNLELKNVAAVAINATLPPFAKPGQKIDITVSSIGNATSLRGGALLMSPLKAADGRVYAVAQGNVLVSGFGTQGSDGSKVTVNVTTAGTIPNGALVEDSVEMPFVRDGAITFELAEPDFTTAQRIVQAINQEFNRKVAHAVDASAISVAVGDGGGGESISVSESGSGYKGEETLNSTTEIHEPNMSRYVPLISRIENLLVEPANTRAKVIVNSRTGTIVVGQEVTIDPVAISHGNLTVIVTERPYVSQPQGFSNGKTVKGKASDININQSSGRAFVFAPGPSLGDLVDCINKVGAAPSDLMAILEAIKSSGALHADLEII